MYIHTVSETAKSLYEIPLDGCKGEIQTVSQIIALKQVRIAQLRLSFSVSSTELSWEQLQHI